ncbi:MAG: hypothetical protein DWH96_09425 [Planctomycetota bacterium]|nr:MAG: hypothetical protein DWH96_09425 [Planctomycetota bacterium]
MDAKPHGAEVNRHAPPRTDVLALIDEMERSVASLRAVHDELDGQRSSTASLADERDGLLENSLAAQARIAHLSCEREEFHAALERARTDIAALKQQLHDAASMNVQWEAECASRASLCSVAEQSLDLLREQYEKASSDASRAQAECESLRASFDSLVIAGGSADQVNASTQALLGEKEALVAEYEDRVASLRRDCEARSRELESAQTNLRLATERLAVLAKHTVEQARKIAELQGLLAAVRTTGIANATASNAWDAERTALTDAFDAERTALHEQMAAVNETQQVAGADTSELLVLRAELARRAEFLTHRKETLHKYRAALRTRKAEWGAREIEIARAVEKKINEVREEARSDAKRDADQRVHEAVTEMQRGGGVPSVTMEEFHRRVREEEERQERERLEMSESRRLLTESEHELVRRYSAARGGMVLALSCIGIAVCASTAWWLSGELAPKTETATVDLAVTSRSGDTNAREAADPSAIIKFIEQAPADPAFHAAVAARLQDRGFTPAQANAEADLLAEHLKVDASNGAFVHLMYAGDARARMVLDTATTTLVNDVNKAPERKQDFLRVSIAGLRQDSGHVVFSESRAMADPGRALRAASIFGGAFGLALLVGFGGWACARRMPKSMEAVD